jgi:hypothetical protein
MPVSIAERSEACTIYDRLNIEIAGSNPDRGMDVCLRVSVLCCPVFRHRPCVGLIPQPKESYQMSVDREVHWTSFRVHSASYPTGQEESLCSVKPVGA